MTPEAVNAYFTPVDYFFYLLTVFIILVVYSQFKWAKICKANVLVLVQRADGHGDYELAPQTGGSVTITNQKDGSMKLWPINDLATIDVPYPGVGFVPAFMQKTIRMVIVSDSNWEPLSNRKPDEMIASPSVLANLMNEKVTGAVMTVNKEMLDTVAGLQKKMGSTLSSTHFWIGIGVLAVLQIVIIAQVLPAMGGLEEMGHKLDVIQQALGITGG